MITIIILINLFSFFMPPPATGSGHNLNLNHAPEWKRSNSGIKDTILINIASTPGDPYKLLACSEKTLYKTSGSGKNWRSILSFKGTDNFITSISLSPGDGNDIYAGTMHGLYRSKDSGNSWKTILNEKGLPILSVTVSPESNETILVGTKAGLLMTEDGGRDWIKIMSLSSDKSVFIINIDKHNPELIYAASETNLYVSGDSGMNWKELYTSNASYKPYRNENTSSEGLDSYSHYIQTARNIRSVALTPYKTGIIYLATSRGLKISNDRGASWRDAARSGLLSTAIYNIAVDPADPYILYAATDKGAFKYSEADNRWQQLYKGLNVSAVNHLAITQRSPGDPGTIWAATDKGIYRSTPDTKTAFIKHDEIYPAKLASHFMNEPGIKEVQKAAIIYAEVQPEKIKRWREAASKKAWLPDLDIDYSYGKDWQSSTYFYSTSSQKYSNDDITKGNDHGWSVSLSWDLGDLVWNSDQTSIDSRSRLVVQLRNDLLNEVTRLYYERRRLQIEMLLYPPNGAREMVEKELRLEELTADIDALTGYYFSGRLKEKEAGL